jgi:release factor glutamine methyltransferase
MVSPGAVAAVDDRRAAGAALLIARRRLARAGIRTAALDAEVLLAQVLRSTREGLLAHPERKLTSAQARRFRGLVSKRASRVPLAYLTGVKEFYGLGLRVTRSVLIPRPETELLVDLAVDFLKRHPGARRVIDLGTGSGAIAIAIAAAVPSVRVEASDIDPPALRVAAGNVRAHRLVSRVRLTKRDLLEGAAQADLVIANLPYLSAIQRRRWPPELSYEPAQALDGGRDGLDLIRRALLQARAVLRPGGAVLLELDPSQAKRVERLARDHWPAAEVTIHPDLAGRARALRVLRP